MGRPIQAGLHAQVRNKARNGVLILGSLKPNSREIAKRMIEQGELIKTSCGRGYQLNEVRND